MLGFFGIYAIFTAKVLIDFCYDKQYLGILNLVCINCALSLIPLEMMGVLVVVRFSI